MDEKRIWYKDKTYKFTMIGMAILMVTFSIGVWIVDGEVKEFGAIYLFGGGMLVTTILSFLFRNNP
jgi:hypothetical protein